MICSTGGRSELALKTILFVGFYYSYRLFRLHWKLKGS